MGPRRGGFAGADGPPASSARAVVFSPPASAVASASLTSATSGTTFSFACSPPVDSTAPTSWSGVSSFGASSATAASSSTCIAVAASASGEASPSLRCTTFFSPSSASAEFSFSESVGGGEVSTRVRCGGRRRPEARVASALMPVARVVGGGREWWLLQRTIWATQNSHLHSHTACRGGRGSPLEVPPSDRTSAPGARSWRVRSVLDARSGSP